MSDNSATLMDSTADVPSTIPDRPTTADIFRARQTIREHVPKTPLVYSDFLSAELDADVYLKRDDTLPTGAFKLRGGLVLAAHLARRESVSKLITASTGNHGQSISYAGRELGVPVEIVVPNEANESKVRAMEALGATVRHHGDSMDEAFAWANRRADEEGFRFVHPANETQIVAGVATAGLEVVEELPDVDVVFSPVGSGSYASGYCLTAGELAGADVIGVQSEGADAAYRAWHDGGMDPIDDVTTFAEGIAVGTPFELTMSVLRDHLTDLVRVSDADLRDAVRRLVCDEHVLAEAAGAASVAGAYARRDRLADRTVVLPISGRNLSASKLASILAE
ncbi:threonine ammonia-lyase [Halovivax limisalsi]|uniref:threonine ammonia-lyase n=1 Tax=Halovivax limisalsi TaxID=1453760 RepID=UPI001FFD6E43|nr:pyridoxal-phosphate dependent enzyme [Halovivax limisalsi]